MNRKRKALDAASSRRPYVKPQLKVHGSLKTLTQAKGSIFNDGSGKPRTRQLFSSNG
jgi:hypothetical protein